MHAYSDSLGAALARQKWVVLATILLTLIGVFGVRYLLPPAYRAQARITIDASRFTMPALLTEAEVLRSSELASRTISELKLENDPELTGVAAPAGKFHALSVNVAAVPAAVREEFQRRLSIEPVSGSYVLLVSYVSSDPEKAALIANTLAGLYIADRAKPAAAPDQSAAIVTLQTRLTQAEETLGSLQTAPAPDRAALEAERAELSKRYGPKHPRMREIEEKIAGLPAVNPSAPTTPDRLKAVQDEIAATRQELAALAAVKSRAAPAQEGAKLVSAANAPATPLHTLPPWSYGVASFIGLILGLLLAVINEKLERKIGNIKNFETLTGQTCAGPVPLRDGSGLAGAGHVLQKPASATSEAVRSLRASLKLIGDKEGRALKIITVTSAQDDEDRARLAIWLARLAARADEKVLLVDADLRSPQIHTLLEASNTPSLVDYLTGQTHLEQIVWKKDPSGMHVIFAQSVPNTAPDLIGSVKMTKLMSYLRQGYELVVICAPGCLSAADASLLANESDHTLFVADTRKTDRGALLRGLKLFSGFGYTSLSPVLTDSRA